MIARYLAVIGSLLLLVGTVTAVVGNNGSGDGDMHIMDGGTSQATTSVNQNGTVWQATVSMIDQTQSNISDMIDNMTYDTVEDRDRVSFDGMISVPSPCHVLTYTVEGGSQDDDYTMTINAVKEQLDGNTTQTCAQVMTGIEYEASFAADAPETVTIVHENTTVDTITFPDDLGQPPEQPGLLERFFAWLGGLI